MATNENPNVTPTAIACRPTWARLPSAPAGLTASVANTPVSSAPVTPPTRCTPTTSRESSYPSRPFNPTAKKQTTPAATPMRSAGSGSTNPLRA